MAQPGVRAMGGTLKPALDAQKVGQSGQVEESLEGGVRDIPTVQFGHAQTVAAPIIVGIAFDRMERTAGAKMIYRVREA
jgi:hypothetical protein